MIVVLIVICELAFAVLVGLFVWWCAQRYERSCVIAPDRQARITYRDCPKCRHRP